MGPFHGLTRVGHEIHDLAAVLDVFLEIVLHRGRHRSAAAQGEDASEPVQHPGDDLGFDLAERWFAVTLEIFGDAHADLVLDFDVGIRERQPPCRHGSSRRPSCR